MKLRIIAVLTLFVLSGLGLYGCSPKEKPVDERWIPSDAELRQINELRVFVVKFHEKWREVEPNAFK